jgi:glycosyltransferase involved in cell wall biosynthesis
MKRVLIIAHSYYNRAGVEEHIRTLSRVLAKQYDIHFIFPYQDVIVHRNQLGEVSRFPVKAISLLSPQNSPSAEAALQQVLETFKPDLLHVAHFLGWPLSIFEILKKSQIPRLISFHDYFAITPIYTLEGQSVTETLSLDYCLKYFGKDISSYLKTRRDFLERAFNDFQVKIVPSQFLADTLNRVFPADYQILPYGIEERLIFPLVPSQRLRFGYVGSLLPQKGWDLLYRAFQPLLLKYSELELHFFGGQRPADIAQHEQIFFHGIYDQPQLAEICCQFDVGVIPSCFPETYSIVLSELWQAKKPVLVADIGALGTRVRDLENGRKFRASDQTDLSEKLEWFITNQDWRAWVAEVPISATQMGERYHGIYQKLLL